MHNGAFYPLDAHLVHPFIKAKSGFRNKNLDFETSENLGQKSSIPEFYYRFTLLDGNRT